MSTISIDHITFNPFISYIAVWGPEQLYLNHAWCAEEKLNLTFKVERNDFVMDLGLYFSHFL